MQRPERGNSMNPQNRCYKRVPPPVPVLQPFMQPEPPPAPETKRSSRRHAMPPELLQLTERLQSADSDTLLLLGLLWLLYRENADKKLILALAYILL